MLDRLAGEHVNNTHLILAKWEEYYSEHAPMLPDSDGEESVSAFLEGCREAYATNSSAASRVQEAANKNCALLRDYMSRLYGLDGPCDVRGRSGVGDVRAEAAGVGSARSGGGRRKSSQLDEFYMDYVERMQRFSESVQIVSQSSELSARYVHPMQCLLT